MSIAERDAGHEATGGVRARLQRRSCGPALSRCTGLPPLPVGCSALLDDDRARALQVLVADRQVGLSELHCRELGRREKAQLKRFGAGSRRGCLREPGTKYEGQQSNDVPIRVCDDPCWIGEHAKEVNLIELKTSFFTYFAPQSCLYRLVILDLPADEAPTRGVASAFEQDAPAPLEYRERPNLAALRCWGARIAVVEARLLCHVSRH